MLSGPIIVVGVVATGSLVLAVGLSVTVMKLKKDFRRLQKRLSEQPHAENPATDFSSSLSRVEQKFIGPKETSVSHAERYRYVASLAKQGVDAAGIAAALQMAPLEVEQLMRLANLNKHNPDGEH